MPILRDDPELLQRFERLRRFGVVHIETGPDGWRAEFTDRSRQMRPMLFQDRDLLSAIALLVRHVEPIVAPPAQD